MRHAGDEGRTVIGAGGLSIDQLLRSWLTTSVARIATAPPRPGVNRTAKGTLPRWMSNR